MRPSITVAAVASALVLLVMTGHQDVLILAVQGLRTVVCAVASAIGNLLLGMFTLCVVIVASGI